MSVREPLRISQEAVVEYGTFTNTMRVVTTKFLPKGTFNLNGEQIDADAVKTSIEVKNVAKLVFTNFAYKTLVKRDYFYLYARPKNITYKIGQKQLEKFREFEQSIPVQFLDSSIKDFFTNNVFRSDSFSFDMPLRQVRENICKLFNEDFDLLVAGQVVARKIFQPDIVRLYKDLMLKFNSLVAEYIKIFLEEYDEIDNDKPLSELVQNLDIFKEGGSVRDLIKKLLDSFEKKLQDMDFDQDQNVLIKELKQTNDPIRQQDILQRIQRIHLEKLGFHGILEQNASQH